MKQLLIILLLLSSLYTSFPAYTQAIINFDFEPKENNGHPLMFWGSRKWGSAPPYQLDTTTAQHGRGSVLFNSNHQEIMLFTRSFPVEKIKDQIITISGYIKVQDFTGQANLYASAFSTKSGEVLAFTASKDSVFLQTSWKKVSIQIPVSEQVDCISIGVRTLGIGKVWFDHLQVVTNEGIYKDAPLEGTEPLLAHVSDTSLRVGSKLNIVPESNSLYQVKIDSFATTLTETSLFIDGTKADSLSSFTFPLKSLPTDTIYDKPITITGIFKQSGDSPKPAELYITLLIIAEEHGYYERHQYITYPLPVASAHEWTPFSIQRFIPYYFSLKIISVGVNVYGKSQLWVEGLQVLIDGKPYQDTTALAPVSAPGHLEVEWLKKQAIKLQTYSPHENQTDLTPIKAIIGESTIVGLGEVTHGSHEIFTMKHRLFRFLVAQKGFTILAIEANMPAAYQLNEFILTGKGDAKKLLAGLGFWTWNTEELLALVLWMRSYNASQATKKIQFVGVDIQSPHTAIENLKEFASRKDSSLLETLRKLEVIIPTLNRDFDKRNLLLNKKDSLQIAIEELMQSVSHRLEINQLNQRLSLKELSWLRQNQRLIYQYITLQLMPDGYTYRDACMAENMEWILSQNPGTKVAIWAHNNHIANQGKDYITPMGEWLKKQYKGAYFSIAFTFHSGTYRAIDNNRLATVAAQASYPGSYEHYFKATNFPSFLLNLQSISLKEENKWLFQKLYLRDIGAEAAYKQYNFVRHDLTREYDAVLYMEQSTASKGVSVLK